MKRDARGTEAAHVGADLTDDHFGGALADSGDRLEASAGFSERGDELLDGGVELGDGGFEVLKVG